VACALLVALFSALLVPLSAAFAQDDTPNESVRGTLADQRLDDEGSTVRTLVPDVQVRVLDAEGNEVGVATSNERGQWEVPVDGPGDYTVEVLGESLPEGVGIVEGADDNGNASITLSVNPQQRRVVNFRLGEDTRVSDTLGRKVLQRSVDGLRFGLIIAMMAIGLSLIYGTTGLVNFAHGELVTWGALLAYWFFLYTPIFGGVQFVIAVILAMLACGASGWGLDRVVFRPLRARGSSLISQLVITIGLSFLFRNFFQYIFGQRQRQYPVQTRLAKDYGPISLSNTEALTMAVSVVVLVAVGLLLTKTRIGKAMRAVADNRDLAASSGIDVQRVISLVWFFGAALAGLGGVLQAHDQSLKFDFGFRLLLLMFAGITLGGLGTAFGAFVGSVIVGLFVLLSTIVLPGNLQNVGAMVIMIVILLVRPQGILGQKERVG
jgi:branched-chain amino acid transport system permease protein